MSINACIFDMDGVIVDTAHYHFKAWKRLAAELGIDLDEDFNEQLKGISRVDSLDRILDKGNLVLDGETKLRLMEKKNRWYLEYIEGMTPEEILPGTLELLHWLKDQSIRTALGSSSRNARIILDKTGLSEWFDVVVDGNMITLSKPDPEVFLKGASMLGLRPSEIAVFEDAVAGIEAARDGGFIVIGIGEPAVLGGADLVVPSLKQFSPEVLFGFTREQ
jgi:beta-phosphoglucomutase